MICPIVNEYAESRTFLHTHAGITEMFTKGGLLLVIAPKFSSANANSKWPSASFAVVECSPSPSPWLLCRKMGGFLLSCLLSFYIGVFPCFGGISLGRNPHLLCLRALRFLICSGLLTIGKMCCACRAHGASGDGAKPLARRDLTCEPASWSERGSWSLV